MAVNMNIIYTGKLKTTCHHEPSGTQITTDAPQDNGGEASAFSPTDLVATALGSCILTTMALVAERNGVDMEGSSLSVIKEMQTTSPRRIRKLTLTLDVKTKAPLEAPMRDKLTRAAHQCPVKLSLHPEVEVDLDLRF